MAEELTPRSRRARGSCSRWTLVGCAGPGLYIAGEAVALYAISARLWGLSLRQMTFHVTGVHFGKVPCTLHATLIFQLG